jgi:phosphoglycerate-specific signal transduction histidine kinase
MIDSVQVVLVLVIVLLTVLLVVLGIQVFFILVDLRKTISKLNKLLENVGFITDSVSGPISFFSTFIAGLKTDSLLTVAKFIRVMLSKEKDDEIKDRKREKDE